MKVYRIQNLEGRGPFLPGFAHTWAKDTEEAHARKTIFEDFGLEIKWLIEANLDKHLGCACQSLDALLKWFYPEELRRLLKAGYRVVEIEADQILCQSDTQLVFANYKPLNSKFRVIPRAELFK